MSAAGSQAGVSGRGASIFLYNTNDFGSAHTRNGGTNDEAPTTNEEKKTLYTLRNALLLLWEELGGRLVVVHAAAASGTATRVLSTAPIWSRTLSASAGTSSRVRPAVVIGLSTERSRCA